MKAEEKSTLPHRNLKTQFYKFLQIWKRRFTLIRFKNWVFSRKRSSNTAKEFENRLTFGFGVKGKHFENGAVFENDVVTIILWFPWPRFLKKQI